MLTRARLIELFNYNPRTGLFTHTGTGKVAAEGQRTGNYIVISIDGRTYGAHRLAFLWMKGRWPKRKIDHRDRDRSNNKWRNIRDATHRQNMRNAKLRSDSTTGLKGVTFHKESKKFRAQIRTDCGRLYLGSFETAKEAHAAYKTAAIKYHGEFART